jgi:hypothetical protein
VILDVVTEDPVWLDWSARAIEACGESRVLVINPLVYSEISVAFERIEELDAVLAPEYLRREALPWEAGFLAGKVFVQYRRAGGRRRSGLL